MISASCFFVISKLLFWSSNIRKWVFSSSNSPGLLKQLTENTMTHKQRNWRHSVRSYKRAASWTHTETFNTSSSLVSFTDVRSVTQHERGGGSGALWPNKERVHVQCKLNTVKLKLKVSHKLGVSSFMLSRRLASSLWRRRLERHQSHQAEDDL